MSDPLDLSQALAELPAELGDDADTERVDSGLLFRGVVLGPHGADPEEFVRARCVKRTDDLRLEPGTEVEGLRLLVRVVDLREVNRPEGLLGPGLPIERRPELTEDVDHDAVVCPARRFDTENES